MKIFDINPVIDKLILVSKSYAKAMWILMSVLFGNFPYDGTGNEHRCYNYINQLEKVVTDHTNNYADALTVNQELEYIYRNKGLADFIDRIESDVYNDSVSDTVYLNLFYSPHNNTFRVAKLPYPQKVVLVIDHVKNELMLVNYENYLKMDRDPGYIHVSTLGNQLNPSKETSSHAFALCSSQAYNGETVNKLPTKREIDLLVIRDNVRNKLTGYRFELGEIQILWSLDLGGDFYSPTLYGSTPIVLHSHGKSDALMFTTQSELRVLDALTGKPTGNIDANSLINENYNELIESDSSIHAPNIIGHESFKALYGSANLISQANYNTVDVYNIVDLSIKVAESKALDSLDPIAYKKGLQYLSNVSDKNLVKDISKFLKQGLILAKSGSAGLKWVEDNIVKNEFGLDPYFSKFASQLIEGLKYWSELTEQEIDKIAGDNAETDYKISASYVDPKIELTQDTQVVLVLQNQEGIGEDAIKQIKLYIVTS